MSQDEKVVITSDRRSLALFIDNLLRQPRRIEDVIRGQKFRVDLVWLCNLVEICEQRLQQNQHNMCSFECMVEYVDGHRDIVYDFESLKNYHSNRQIMSSGFDLSFSYLVDFANQSKPEKQDIRVRVRSSFPSKSAIRKEQSSIYTAIPFSNLTWGRTYLVILLLTLPQLSEQVGSLRS